jgi:hypothetical protein
MTFLPALKMDRRQAAPLGRSLRSSRYFANRVGDPGWAQPLGRHVTGDRCYVLLVLANRVGDPVS